MRKVLLYERFKLGHHVIAISLIQIDRTKNYRARYASGNYPQIDSSIEDFKDLAEFKEYVIEVTKHRDLKDHE